MPPWGIRGIREYGGIPNTGEYGEYGGGNTGTHHLFNSCHRENYSGEE